MCIRDSHLDAYESAELEEHARQLQAQTYDDYDYDPFGLIDMDGNDLDAPQSRSGIGTTRCITHAADQLGRLQVQTLESGHNSGSIDAPSPTYSLTKPPCVAGGSDVPHPTVVTHRANSTPSPENAKRIEGDENTLGDFKRQFPGYAWATEPPKHRKCPNTTIQPPPKHDPTMYSRVVANLGKSKNNTAT